MDDKTLLAHLETLAANLDVEIRYELLEGDSAFHQGGLCRIRNQQVIFIDSRSSTRDKINILAKALRRFDLGHIYIRPALRDLLDKILEG